MIHAESKEEHWKHDLPGLSFEMRKRCLLMCFHLKCVVLDCLKIFTLVKSYITFSSLFFFFLFFFFFLSLFYRLRCKLRICWRSCMPRCRCCCKVSRKTSLSRWSLEHLIDTPEHRAAARAILGSSLSRYLVWARELEFYHILAIAARHARRKTMSGAT